MTKGTIKTWGYERRKLADLQTLLQENGVKRLVDCRSHTSSQRKPEFSGRSLMKLCESLGVEYINPKAMGGKPFIKESATTWIQENLKDGDLLMCFEADHLQCHRGCALMPICKAEGFEVIHLSSSAGIFP